ncbi:MAG: methionine--tRNA ligase [Bacillota bacterium]|nr:methionine--tRNA ligase [Bacillota bacterium]
MAKPTFYITTPIYYPSDRLHIGHAYTTVATDTLCRWKRLDGYDVFFLTGTDEHGQKMQRRAEKAGKSPQEFVDSIVVTIRDLWDVLKIQYDDFIRTTEDRHVARVKQIFEKIYKKGDIYKAEYEGWYCADCEAYFTETQHKDLDGRCPDHDRPLERLREESYFFKLSKYSQRLLEHIDKNPDFIQPESRRNEMVSFIKSGLDDLCVSRTTFSWGVPVDFDPKHVVYVWFDALTNYITALGYPDGDLYKKYWPADVHLMGKEIVRFHSIIWPIILMALDEPLPKKVYGHGWLILESGKMSKTKGNVVDPVHLVAKYGLDAVRYFLLREIPFGSDGVYSEEALVARINADLANDLGNLLNRTLTVFERSSGGLVPAPGRLGTQDEALKRQALALAGEVRGLVDRLEISNAVAATFKVVSAANKYIDEQAPWSLAKQGKTERLGTVLYVLAEVLRILATILQPFLIEGAGKMWSQLGLGDSIPGSAWADLDRWGVVRPGTQVKKGRPLFPRIDTKEALDGTPQAPAKVAATPVSPVAEEAPQVEEPTDISIEAFQQVDLRTAKIVAAEQVKGTQKLLRLVVDIGSEQREIVSGIADYYTPESLVGKTIIVIVNLKPAKIRGVESRGMLLAATRDERLVLLTSDNDIPPGSKIS